MGVSSSGFHRVYPPTRKGAIRKNSLHPSTCHRSKTVVPERRVEAKASSLGGYHLSGASGLVVSASLNKKVLCFVDEYGTAGQDQFYLGVVLVMAREAGRVDKCFSDLLRPSANELHAVALDDRYIQGLMQRFRAEAPSSRVTMINNKIAVRGGEPPILYAHAVVETVKIGLRRFTQDVLGKETIGNIDVITDVNQHNDHPAFDAEMDRAREHDGRFKGVNRVVRLDSAASRLLQLADMVAYSRKWIVNADINARGLHERFGIQLP